MITDHPLLKQACFIGGLWAHADDGATIEVTNPATGERIGTVPRCGRSETARGY